MGRPRRWRHIHGRPGFQFFAPCPPDSNATVVTLRVEEFEAMRLKHLGQVNSEGREVPFTQAEAAAQMRVSQPTFSRILESAHRKVTTALLNGYGLSIEGGMYGIKEIETRYGCQDCTIEWEIPKDFNAEAQPTPSCPKCGSARTFTIKREVLRRSQQ